MVLNPYYDAWRRMYGRLIPDIYQSYYQGAFPSGSAMSPTAVPQSAQVGFSPLANQPSSFATQFNAPSGTQQAYSYGQNIGLQPAGAGQKGQGQKGSAGHPVYDPYWQYYNPKTKKYEQEKVTQQQKGKTGYGFPDYGPPPEGYKYGDVPYYNPQGSATGAYAPATTQPATTQPTTVPGSPAATGQMTQSWYQANNPQNLSWEAYNQQFKDKQAYMQQTYGISTPQTQPVQTYTPPAYTPTSYSSGNTGICVNCKSPTTTVSAPTTTKTTGGSYVTEAQKKALQAKGLWKPTATYDTAYLKSLGV